GRIPRKAARVFSSGSPGVAATKRNRLRTGAESAQPPTGRDPITDPALKRFRSGFSHSAVSRLRRHREHRSEGVADAEQRSELFKDSACRIVQSRNDLLPGERSEIISEFRPQEHVREQTELHASADAEDDFPDVIRSEAGDLRNRLRERLRTGDDIFLRAGTSGDKGPQTMFARLEVEQ